MIRFIALVLSLTTLAAPSLAHAPIKGIGTFYNGVLHPLLVPSHLLLVIAIGLWLGQHAPRPGRLGWFAFVVAFWIALAVSPSMGSSMPEPVLITFALVAGLLVVLERSFGITGMVVLATVAGLGIGLDSPPDFVQRQEMWLALIGTGTGGVLMLSYVGGIAAGLAQPWQRIGIRVAGSWTAASAALVLALALAGPRAAG